MANAEDLALDVARVPMVSSEIDPIELARGHLALLAYETPTQGQEVHIQRMRHAFERAGAASSLKVAMHVLSLMREAQHLGHGYWFATPTRVIDADNIKLLISVSPTREIARHFPSVHRTGYGRLISEDEAKELPHQNLSQWLGSTPPSASAYVQAQLDQGHASLAPTIANGDLEFFGVKTSMTGFTTPNWGRDRSKALVQTGGLIFCRERIAVTAFKYFFGKFEQQRLVAESNHAIDEARLQFGLATAANRKLSIAVISTREADFYHFPMMLPRPERRLLLALARRDRQKPGRTYLVSKTASSVLRKHLRMLGADITSKT